MRIVTTLLAFAVTVAPGQAAPADFTFAYSYPAAAARITRLRAWFEAERASLRARVARDAAADRRAAAKDGYPFRPYEVRKSWAVVTETPVFLSLSSELYTYSGGAHGNTGSGALLWDKKAGQRIDTKSVFVSGEALDAAIRAPYCKALDDERVRRAGSVDKDGPFGQCPKLGELTLLLGSTSRAKIDRLGLVADQYVAGSYAEGRYVITLPVTSSILAIVKPAYRTAFAIGRGTPQAEKP